MTSPTRRSSSGSQLAPRARLTWVRVIGVVPVLSNLILGDDENLMGAYFAMTGNWKRPRAQLIPVKSFAEGPAHFMLEGPELLWNGIRRLESLLNPSSSPPAAAKEGEPGPCPARGGLGTRS